MHLHKEKITTRETLAPRSEALQNGGTISRKKKADLKSYDSLKRSDDVQNDAHRKKGVVQRVLVPLKTPAVLNANVTNIINDANEIEDLTTNAYNNTWNRLVASTQLVAPVPLAIENFPGVTPGHFGHFLNTLDGNNNTQKAMATGYVIEDQVTFGGELPDAAAAQVGVGNAIPDFVITHKGTRGIVDITSSGQQGHVLNKKFNPGGFAYIGEATYPSINFGALAGVAPAMAGNAFALAQNARNAQANRYFNKRLGELRMQSLLLQNGVLQNDRRFEVRATFLRTGIRGMQRKQNVTDGDITALDRRVDQVNARIPYYERQALGLPSIISIVASTQGRYMVAGKPHW
jgi:hypothetical protein